MPLAAVASILQVAILHRWTYSIGGRTAQVAVLRNALTSGRVYGVKTFGEDSMCRHVQQAVVLCCWTFPSDRFFLFFCAW